MYSYPNIKAFGNKLKTTIICQNYKTKEGRQPNVNRPSPPMKNKSIN